MAKNISDLLYLGHPRPHFPGELRRQLPGKNRPAESGRPDGKGRKHSGIGRRGFLAGDAFDPILPGEPGPVACPPGSCAFNAMGLDYFTLGNHDFNFGYEALRDYLRAMDGVCLCANVEDLGGELPIRPWAVHTLATACGWGSPAWSPIL